MKNLVKRILGVMLSVFITTVFFFIVVSCSKKEKTKEYSYLTIDMEWGTSNKCYIDKNQYTVCEIEGELTMVRQYYEE